MTSPSFSAGEPTPKRTESGSSKNLATAYTSTLKFKQLNEVSLIPSPILSDTLTVRVESAKYDRIENRKTSRHPDSHAKVPLLDVMKRYLYFTLTRQKHPESVQPTYYMSESLIDKNVLIAGLGLKDPEDIRRMTGTLSTLINIDQVIEIINPDEHSPRYLVDGENKTLIDEGDCYRVIDQENFRDVDFWGFKILDTLP